MLAGLVPIVGLGEVGRRLESQSGLFTCVSRLVLDRLNKDEKISFLVPSLFQAMRGPHGSGLPLG